MPGPRVSGGSAGGVWTPTEGPAPHLSPHTSGILPPDNPSALGPGAVLGACYMPGIGANESGVNESGACVAADLAGIQAEQASEGGGVTPMQLPSNWYTLTPPEQVFVATNLERIDRGLSPLLGMNPCLDGFAALAVPANVDPFYPIGDQCLGLATAEAGIVGGGASPLAINYDWMYFDGPGGNNLDCMGLQMWGCWGHRDSIIANYASLGQGGPCVVGTAFAQADYAELFLCVEPGGPTPPMNFTWASEVPYLGTPPVAPDFTLSASSSDPTMASGTGGSVTITATASTGYSYPIALSVWAAPNEQDGFMGGSVQFSPPTMTFSGSTASSVMEVAGAALPGRYPMTVTALGADWTLHTISILLTVTGSGYWMVSYDGQVYGFGGAPVYIRPAPPGNPFVPPGQAVGMAVSSGGAGYWVASADGQVTSYGYAISNFTLSGTPTTPVVTIASSADGQGYWLATAGGQVLSAGDAVNYGSPAALGLTLNAPIVDMVPTPDGAGYWLLAADGGVFSFGDAQFYGSTGNMHLVAPAVGLYPTPDGKGYWFVASDGGIFAFGDASYYGSCPAAGSGCQHLVKPIEGIVGTSDGKGYWMVASDGGIFAFGDAGFVGSLGASPPASPIVGFTAD